MCSMKCVRPLVSGVSWREPTRTNSEIVVEWRCGISTVETVRPFSRVWVAS